MTINVRGLALLALFAYAPAVAQERQHDQQQAQKEAASAKPATTKCCEGMDKMGEMTGVMPMKGEMTGDMKSKMEMMKEMKTKIAEKMKEKGMERLNSKGSEPTVEKNQSTKDAHQH